MSRGVDDTDHLDGAARRVADLRASVPVDIEKAYRRRIDEAVAELRAYCAVTGLSWEPVQ